MVNDNSSCKVAPIPDNKAINQTKKIWDSYYNREWPLGAVLREVGPGWRHLVCRLIRDLFELGWDGHLHQIKEKFGGLRFYIGGGTDEIWARIQKAEDESYKICEDCGKPGKAGGTGWIRTLCKKCRGKLEKGK